LNLSSKITVILLFTTVLTSTGQTADSLPARKERVRRYTVEPVRSTMFAAAMPGL
jgi:hypothetical protein